MSQPFLPACQPLLLSSLPYRSAAQALDVTRRYAGQLLGWPQLPNRSYREQLLVQSAVGFPGLVVDPAQGRVYVERAQAIEMLDRLALAYLEHDISYAALADDDASGLGELFRQRDSLRGVLALKGQLLGPVSIAAQLTDEHQRPLIYDDMFFDALAQHLHLRAAWQNARISELCSKTIICLEEPFLDAVSLSFLPVDWERACAQIDEVLLGVSGYKALYACGAVEWQRVLQTSVDLIIADVFSSGEALVAAGAALVPFLERGGMVGLGLVPVDPEMLERLTPEVLLGRVAGFLGELKPFGIESEMLLQHAVLSTTDGLGRLSVEAAERALALLAETSALLRKQYNLT